jgi:hypothetical protein
MNEEQQKLERIVELRSMFMLKDWEESNVDFSHKTFIIVKFFNSESDFRETRYPADVDKVIEIQQQKLLRDIKSYVGGSAYMDELLEVMVG